MPVDHYENFPVASFLLPAGLRPAVETIYAFARSADDLADEGSASATERLNALCAYENELDRIERGENSELPLFQKLGKIVSDYALSLEPLRELLSAFKQDVLTQRYLTIELLMDYCRRSANPVGRIMLRLYDEDNALNVRDSDAICSALQLINFWQDVAVDWCKQRIYLPDEDMRRFAVDTTHLDLAITDARWRALMCFEVGRARSLILSGAPLSYRLPGRIGWELRLVVQGGLRILERIEAADYDIFNRRPKLDLTDWLRICWRALWMKRAARTP